MGYRTIKQEVSRLLVEKDFDRSLEAIRSIGLQKTISPLIALLNSKSQLQRWRAVSGLGVVVAALAEQDTESARVVVRRLMWSLNDESGGIGWGAPEAMGEITARNQGLAQEYAKILISYINPAGNYLEHPVLQRGLLWGLARLAHARPNFVQGTTSFLAPFTRSEDPIHRGLAAWTLAAQGTAAAQSLLAPLTDDQARITLYWGHTLHECRISELARNEFDGGV